MSISIMTAVWQLDLPPSQKLVMLALADNANDSGQCWPSMATLTSKTSLSERTVQANIKALSEAGKVSVQERSGRSNIYLLTPAAIAPPQPLRPAAAAPTPANPAPPPPQLLHPTPATAAPRTIIEPSFEPPRNTPVRAKRDSLSADFEQFLESTYPQTSHGRNTITAVHRAQGLISSGKVTEADLRARLVGFRAFADSGGYSDPSKVPSMASWFEPHGDKRYWSRDWKPVPSKAQQQQDATIAAGLAFLNRDRSRSLA